MLRPKLLALPLAAGAALALPAGAVAAPQLSVSLPKTTTTGKNIKFTSVARGVDRRREVELQVFRNGIWAFQALAERGRYRGSFNVTGDIREVKLRLAVRRGSRFSGATSRVHTLRWFDRISAPTLFGSAPRLFQDRRFQTIFYAPIDVPAGRSACTRIDLEMLLAFAPAGTSGTFTVTQAGRAPQTVTVASNESATLPVRLTPNRAYRIDVTVPERVEPSGESPRLLANGAGRCFSRSPLPNPQQG